MYRVTPVTHIAGEKKLHRRSSPDSFESRFREKGKENHLPLEVNTFRLYSRGESFAKSSKMSRMFGSIRTDIVEANDLRL